MQNIISTRKFPFFDIIEGENFINNDNQINEIPISQENKLNEVQARFRRNGSH